MLSRLVHVRFAMKKLDKRRLKSKHQETSAVHERNVLAEVRCNRAAHAIDEQQICYEFKICLP